MINIGLPSIVAVPIRNNSLGPKIVFFSPGFSKRYPQNIDCIRILHAPKSGKQPLLKIPLLEIDGSPNCSKDWLEIRNGSSRASPQVPGSPFCGKAKPKNILMNDSVWVRFVSDNSTDNSELKGFFLAFYTGNYSDRREDDIYHTNQPTTGW